MPPTVLVSAPGAAAPDDLREWLARAGFAVRAHELGSPPGVDLTAFDLAVIEVGPRHASAVAQTRRWRAELGDTLVPIVWVRPEGAEELNAIALDAGADAVLARPLEGPVFVAQARAAVRTRATAARVAERATEARLLAEQASRARAQLDRELDAARRVRLALLPRSLPPIGPVRFAVSHRARARAGGDFFGAHRLGDHRVAFHLGDVIAPGSGCGLLGPFIAEHLARDTPDAATPAGRLVSVNRALLQLGIDELPLVALLVGVIDTREGTLTVARAGLPAPVHIPAESEPVAWALPGPFLGIAETTYPEHTAVWRPGDKFVAATDGAVPLDAPPLAVTVTPHRSATGQAFADAVAREVLARVPHEDDVTLLCVELLATADIS